MNTRMKVSICSFFFYIFLCWYGGGNFFIRSIDNAFLLFIGIIFTFFVYMAPTKFEDDNKFFKEEL